MLYVMKNWFVMKLALQSDKLAFVHLQVLELRWLRESYNTLIGVVLHGRMLSQVVGLCSYMVVAHVQVLIEVEHDG